MSERKVEIPLIIPNQQPPLNSNPAIIPIPPPPSEVDRNSHVKRNSIQEIDLEWENLKITANITIRRKKGDKIRKIKEEKVLLNSISGVVSHGRFTAIMGPSGSGKTTLLNALSARMFGKRLKAEGIIKLNSHQIEDLTSITNIFAYIMQDDILMATSTPREAFNFVANLRLKLSRAERYEKVEKLLGDLDLVKCANTKIGNYFIRGISGGERKRTSIGIELISNPSIIFLDEPTTGLDSVTSLHLLKLLNKLAREGRTVLCTIHQPNSETFQEFGDLILMVRGNIIYQGDTKQSIAYFASIGFDCPKFSNPADYFMKIMSESGNLMNKMKKGANDKGSSQEDIHMINEADNIEQKFNERVKLFIDSYNRSGQKELAKQNLLKKKVTLEKNRQILWLKQFWLIMLRNFQFELRNPADFAMKIFQNIVFSVIVMIVWWQTNGETKQAVQSIAGVLFFLTLVTGFGGINGSIHVFSLEKPIFIRERFSGYYSTTPYFFAKTISEIPFLFFYSILIISITYYAIGLRPEGHYFGMALLAVFLGHLAGSGFGVIISTYVSSLEVALSLTPIFVIPFMLMGGFLATSDQVPGFLVWVEYISVFKYTFTILLYNEYEGRVLACSSEIPTCNPLIVFNQHISIGLAIVLLIVLFIGFRLIALIGLKFISTPKPVRINKKANSKASNSGNGTQPPSNGELFKSFGSLGNSEFLKSDLPLKKGISPDKNIPSINGASLHNGISSPSINNHTPPNTIISLKNVDPEFASNSIPLRNGISPSLNHNIPRTNNVVSIKAGV